VIICLDKASQAVIAALQHSSLAMTTFSMSEKESKEKWWQKVPVLSHIVNAIMWMFGKK